VTAAFSSGKQEMAIKEVASHKGRDVFSNSQHRLLSFPSQKDFYIKTLIIFRQKLKLLRKFLAVALQGRIDKNPYHIKI
jgi:hypothetical protein